MDQPVMAFDWARMFIGDQPPLFYAEILFRTVLIYAYTFLLVRWVGGRSIAQLSVVEFVLVIALGSAVGDPLFYPDVPLLQAMAVITIVVLINKGLDTLILHFARVEQAVDGLPIQVVANGRILVDNAAIRNLSRAELFEQLRLAGVANLGEVASAYVESNGRISVFRRRTPRRGLAIVPPPVSQQRKPSRRTTGALCCAQCGTPGTPADGLCRHCNADAWAPSVLSR